LGRMYKPVLDLNEHAENVVAAESISLVAANLYNIARLLSATSLASSSSPSPSPSSSSTFSAAAFSPDLVAHGMAERKLGNLWNEVGKLRASKGLFQSAKQAYMLGVKCFSAAQDIPNATLLLCNLNHMFRSLAMSCQTASDVSKEAQARSLQERLKTLKLYLLEGLECLSEARQLFSSARLSQQDSSQVRVGMEEAMNHLLLGFELSSACQQPELLDVNILEQYSNEATQHLSRALQIYERLKDRDDVAHGKACATHYHVAKHLAWEWEQLGGPKYLDRTTCELVKRHYMMAVKGLTGAALDQCKADFKAFLGKSGKSSVKQ